MAWTSTRLEWVCQDCEFSAQRSRTKSRGFINGMIEPNADWGPHVEGIAVTENDWSKDLLLIKRLIRLDLRKLKRHHGHRVTIRLTGERLARVQRRIGKIPDEEP